jgi:hypothetical protein
MAAILTFLFAIAAHDPRQVLLGKWEGTSTCTKVRAACRDEVVVSHVTPGPSADVVTVAMNKVVDGQELEMGSLDFHVDFAKHTLEADFDNGSVASHWSFTFTDQEWRGTATVEGAVIRNVLVHR